MTIARITRTLFAILVLFFSYSVLTEAAESKQESAESVGLLARSGLVPDPQKMISNYLLDRLAQARAHWQAAYDHVVTPEDVLAYQTSRIDYFRRQLGAMWDKTPLNARIVGTFQIEGVRVEKILFQSVPGFYVTATMYLPSTKQYKPPYPAVLGLCGHNPEGKAAKRQILACVFAARCGLAMFVIDPIDQGERLIHLKPDGKPYVLSVPGHNLLGASSILVGRNAATFEVWDMIRAIDYLQSRSDIIPDKIGAAGCSGGGTQTSYIMALDERIVAAAPSCYTCGLFGQLGQTLSPQDAEQNIFGQLAHGIDHADFSIMRAPRPTLLCTATRDAFNIADAWDSYRLANRIYSRLGLPERMSILESDDPHGYWLAHRVGTVRFMLRWLAGRDEAVTEPENMPVVTEEEIRVLPLPGIMGIKNARTTYDLNRDLEAKLKQQRRKRWASMTATQARDLVRTRAGIAPLADLPVAVPCLTDREKTKFVLKTRDGIYVPVRVNRPNNVSEWTLYIDDKGLNGPDAKKQLADSSRSIAVVELPGWGESLPVGKNYFEHKRFGTDGTQFYMAYLMGRSVVGLRTEDLLCVARYFKNELGVKLRLQAEGSARIPALHASIAEPELFTAVQIDSPQTLKTWSSLIEESPCPIRLSDCIHGVLLDYDLDDLMKYVASRK